MPAAHSEIDQVHNHIHTRVALEAVWVGGKHVCECRSAPHLGTGGACFVSRQAAFTVCSGCPLQAVARSHRLCRCRGCMPHAVPACGRLPKCSPDFVGALAARADIEVRFAVDVCLGPHHFAVGRVQLRPCKRGVLFSCRRQVCRRQECSDSWRQARPCSCRERLAAHPPARTCIVTAAWWLPSLLFTNMAPSMRGPPGTW